MNQPGLNTYLEIQAMFAAGVSPSEILDAATIANARWLDLDRDYGTVEEGKIANLLLLRDNPLVATTAWGNIELVILHGVLLERESLLPRR